MTEAAIPLELVLASGSPRRAELLEMLRIPFRVEIPDVEELALSGESAQRQVERLAREKARSVAERCSGRWIIAGDTVVVLDDEVLGKPSSIEEAVAMLLELQGRTHLVSSGVAVCSPDGEVRSGVETSRVTFRPFDRSVAEAYARTGEPMDKAGAYGIQGFGATLVRRVEGDFYGVVGFPVVLLLDLLRQGGAEYRFGKWIPSTAARSDDAAAGTIP